MHPFIFVIIAPLAFRERLHGFQALAVRRRLYLSLAAHLRVDERLAGREEGGICLYVLLCTAKQSWITSREQLLRRAWLGSLSRAAIAAKVVWMNRPLLSFFRLVFVMIVCIHLGLI